MKTRLTEEQIQRGLEFLKDLRANPHKAKKIMRRKLPDGTEERCCLCVAYDTAQRLGANLEELEPLAAVPPDEIADFYGWNRNTPYVAGTLVTILNDGVHGIPEKTHAEIADLFEQEFPQLKIAALKIQMGELREGLTENPEDAKKIFELEVEYEGLKLLIKPDEQES